MKTETKVQRIEQKIRDLEAEKFALIHAQQPNAHKFKLELTHELQSSDVQVRRLAEELDIISRPILRKIRDEQIFEEMTLAFFERNIQIWQALTKKGPIKLKIVPNELRAEFNKAKELYDSTTDRELADKSVDDFLAKLKPFLN